MRADADVMVIGAGVAGSSIAILLANAGWNVVLIEQHRYPRRKVCGECIAAGNLVFLDELGIGTQFQRLAGPELRQVGWMSRAETVIADMPACAEGPYRYGRALGRDSLDSLLIERARSMGVTVLQPAKVRAIRPAQTHFDCEYDLLAPPASGNTMVAEKALRAAVIIDAHGSWERGPTSLAGAADDIAHAPRLSSDLLAFKATFRGARLPAGLLPVIAFKGGYGGMVVADQGLTTIACCIRRDVLRQCRALAPGEPAGLAVEAHLRRSCRAIDDVLSQAQRQGAWLSVGPIRPGIRVDAHAAALRVGNAAGETHPLVGEGIGMALRSAALLARHLIRQPIGTMDASCRLEVQQSYAKSWRREFAPRLRLAAAYAHIAMSPFLAPSAGAMLRRWPALLTLAARLAGKARHVALQRPATQELA